MSTENGSSPKNDDDVSTSNITDKEKSTVLVWNEQKWNLEKEGSKKVVEFLFVDEPEITEKKELPLASLEFNVGGLHLLFENNNDTTVKKLIIDKIRRNVTINTLISYAGSVTKILTIRNVQTNEVLEKPSSKDLFKFIKNFENDIENQPPSDTNEPRTRKRRGSAIKGSKAKISKVTPKSATKLEKENFQNLKIRISKETPLESDTRFLSLNLLQNDYTVRTTSEENVDVILQQIKDGRWKEDIPIFVNKPNDADHFFVFNGNTRLNAIKKFNAETPDKKNEILTIKCIIYKDLNFDQKLVITAKACNNSTPEFEYTILQQTKLLLKVVQQHSLAIPYSKKDVEQFTELVNFYLPQSYSPICIELIKLPEDLLNSMFEITVNDVPIEHQKLSSNFLKAFCNAAKNNSNEALLLLNELNKKTARDVEKHLKNVKQDLLEFLKKRGPHSYNTEQEAIDDLAGDIKIGKEDLITALRSINWLNNKRNNPQWDSIKEKLATHFQQNLIYKNAKFVEEIDDALLSSQNFIITQNHTIEMKLLLEKYLDNFTLLLIGNLGEDPPNKPNMEPTAIFDVLLEEPVVIDKVMDHIPITAAKAYLYLPNAPKGNQLEKNRFLSEMALNKQCPLGLSWKLQTCHFLAKLTTNYENVLLYNTPLGLTEHFLSNLNYYQRIFVNGNNELKNLVAACFTTAKENNQDETNEFNESAEQ